MILHSRIQHDLEQNTLLAEESSKKDIKIVRKYQYVGGKNQDILGAEHWLHNTSTLMQEGSPLDTVN